MNSGVSPLPFCDRIEQVSLEKRSNLILALDFPFEKPENRGKLVSNAERVLDQVHPYICALKLNHHLTLPLGLFDGVQALLKRAHDFGLVSIMDCKANDIGSTNQVIAQYYYAAGFDALIANPIIGWDEGLKPIFDVAKQTNRGVIFLVYMSHKAANEGYGQTVLNPETHQIEHQYVSFARKALQYKADGAVVGATYPDKIREVHEILGDSLPIYSPGIGMQGGEISKVMAAGASYLIVGRSITQAENPASAAEQCLNLSRTR